MEYSSCLKTAQIISTQMDPALLQCSPAHHHSLFKISPSSIITEFFLEVYKTGPLRAVSHGRTHISQGQKHSNSICVHGLKNQYTQDLNSLSVVLDVCLICCFTALQHYRGHFELGQLTYPHFLGTGFLSSKPVLSAHTDNCPTWISCRERMAIEISLLKICGQTRGSICGRTRGSNLRPPDY